MPKSQGLNLCGVKTMQHSSLFRRIESSARIIYFSGYVDHSSDLLGKLDWEKLEKKKRLKVHLTPKFFC